MKHYVTIYIQPMDWSIPHAFLGLTKGKSPDELDKIDDELKSQRLKNKEWDEIDKRWYITKETNEFNDGFYGFAPVESKSNHWGKVFENNQYEPQWNEEKQQYDYKLRSKETFNVFNRLILEISQEQYETLLKEIKKEVEKTKDRNSNLQRDGSKMSSLKILKENLYYNSNPINLYAIHNCTTWLLNKLSNIGIEVIYNEEWMPDSPIFNNLKELFPYINSLHSIFLKFQNIDENLQSVKGARAFMLWTRAMLDNNYICYIDENILEKQAQFFCKKDIENQRYYESIKKNYSLALQFKSIYNKLNFCLESITKKFNENPKGTFELIYFDKNDKQIKLLKANNHYKVIVIKELDLSQKQNNFSASKFYPFIFMPKDESVSKVLYHQYDYDKVSQVYQRDKNEFYFTILAGKRNDKFWSPSYHKMTKNLKKVYAS